MAVEAPAAEAAHAAVAVRPGVRMKMGARRSLQRTACGSELPKSKPGAAAPFAIKVYDGALLRRGWEDSEDKFDAAFPPPCRTSRCG